MAGMTQAGILLDQQVAQQRATDRIRQATEELLVRAESQGWTVEQTMKEAARRGISTQPEVLSYLKVKQTEQAQETGKKLLRQHGVFSHSTAPAGLEAERPGGMGADEFMTMLGGVRAPAAPQAPQQTPLTVGGQEDMALTQAVSRLPQTQQTMGVLPEAPFVSGEVPAGLNDEEQWMLQQNPAQYESVMKDATKRIQTERKAREDFNRELLKEEYRQQSMAAREATGRRETATAQRNLKLTPPAAARGPSESVYQSKRNYDKAVARQTGLLKRHSEMNWETGTMTEGYRPADQAEYERAGREATGQYVAYLLEASGMPYNQAQQKMQMMMRSDEGNTVFASDQNTPVVETASGPMLNLANEKARQALAHSAAQIGAGGAGPTIQLIIDWYMRNPGAWQRPTYGPVPER